jgi:hypothetical protein
LPRAVERWSRRARWFRALDALTAWLVAWATASTALPWMPTDASALASAVAVGILGFVPPIRAFWRPITACVALLMSRRLRPGDGAWYVSPGHAQHVLVTGRRLLHLVIVAGGHGPVEGINVRRTRVLLVPEDRVSGRAPSA